MCTVPHNETPRRTVFSSKLQNRREMLAVHHLTVRAATLNIFANPRKAPSVFVDRDRVETKYTTSPFEPPMT